MNETDLIWMTAVVFIPSVFALGLLFFPKGAEEAMRWWSLFGTALTLGASLCVFIQYKIEVVDRNSSGEQIKSREKMSLLDRAGNADVRSVENKAPDSQDWIG